MVKKLEKPFSELHSLAVKVAKNIHIQDAVEHGRSIDKFGEIKNFVGDVDWVIMDIN